MVYGRSRPPRLLTLDSRALRRIGSADSRKEKTQMNVDRISEIQEEPLRERSWKARVDRSRIAAARSPEDHHVL